MKIVKYLTKCSSDLLRYDSEDVTAPTDPLTYRTPEGDSCLHVAALRGDVHAVTILLYAGLDPNLPGDMGNTSLHYAGQHHAVRSLLLKMGASPDPKNDFGRKAVPDL
jgi:ankyrin repeat protein